jgi:DNA repair photolyase
MTPNKGEGRMVPVFPLLAAAGVVIGVIVAPYVPPVMTQLAKYVGVPAQAQVGQVSEYYIKIKGGHRDRAGSDLEGMDLQRDCSGADADGEGR